MAEGGAFSLPLCLIQRQARRYSIALIFADVELHRPINYSNASARERVTWRWKACVERTTQSHQ